jgi:hypothetical protein
LGTTDVELCNWALTEVGATRITALADDSKEARVCNEHYDKVKRYMLSIHPWNFNIVRAEFAEHADEPEWGYAHQFEIPEDCGRILTTEYPDIKYEIEGDVVVTDESTFKCTYASTTCSEALFRPYFEKAFALELARTIAYSLVQNASLKETLTKSAILALREARSFDAQEGSPQDVHVNTWTDERF